MSTKKFIIFALGAHGDGISGGDRIFIELAKRAPTNTIVEIYVNEEGRRMCLRNNLRPSKKIKYKVSKLKKYRKFGFLVFYLSLIIESIRLGLTLNLETKEYKSIYLYSASEFLMDVFPAAIIKLRHSETNWIAAWYQTAPNPLKGFSIIDGESRHRIRSFPYFFFQQISKPFINKLADKICVNNKTEKKFFPKKDLFVMYGAIDTNTITKFAKKFKNIKKKYAGVFQGRFHPQKGVEELIDIWKMVVKVKPKEKLAMIGDGPLMKSVKEKIVDKNLQDNVDLFGYVFDGEKKYKIFSQSKIVVHPALYDSGGMASAEAMAFGAPVIGYNMPSYKDYYKKGMLKVKIGDKKSFAKAITELLDNNRKYVKLASDASESAKKDWSWNNRAKDFFNFIENGK